MLCICANFAEAAAVAAAVVALVVILLLVVVGLERSSQQYVYHSLCAITVE
jgi:hypothetical protein